MGEYILGTDAPSPVRFKHVSRKDIDNALHDIEVLAKRWRDRLTFENLAFAKRYLWKEK